jgi:hypothetical protein
MNAKGVLLVITMIITLSFLNISCLSNKQLVLKEVSPEGGDGSGEGEEKPAISGMIVEIEEVYGEQKYIYMKLGSKNKGIKRGLKGYIFNDTAMTEKIGKFEFIEVYWDYSKGRILELNNKIKPNAIVSIEVDPKKLIK